MAELFEWNAAQYGLDVPEMDKEHLQLIAYMNRLHELHEKHAATAELAAALDKLVKFTVKHFADEEAYMAKIGYPALKTHAGIHKNLLDQVTAHVEAFQKNGKFKPDFFEFLTFWLKAHIRGVDVKYAKHSAVA